jgi:hypothetical protein
LRNYLNTYEFEEILDLQALMSKLLLEPEELLQILWKY